MVGARRVITVLYCIISPVGGPEDDRAVFELSHSLMADYSSAELRIECIAAFARNLMSEYAELDYDQAELTRPSKAAPRELITPRVDCVHHCPRVWRPLRIMPMLAVLSIVPFALGLLPSVESCVDVRVWSCSDTMKLMVKDEVH